MAKNKLLYQNWIVELGFDPGEKQALFKHLDEISLEELIEEGYDQAKLSDPKENESKSIRIEEAVRFALDQLDDEEREFIIRYHFMGESYKKITDKSYREFSKLTSLHKQAFKKLKRHLKSFARDNYAIDDKIVVSCPVCLSDQLVEINYLLKQRDPEQTWKPILKILDQKYKIKIVTPQILIGHEKYH